MIEFDGEQHPQTFSVKNEVLGGPLCKVLDSNPFLEYEPGGSNKIRGYSIELVVYSCKAPRKSQGFVNSLEFSQLFSYFPKKIYLQFVLSIFLLPLKKSCLCATNIFLSL